tara:strand:+ start:113 stop:814 length:702 start_codon:yes stop_codon:yes gene_type:complete
MGDIYIITTKYSEKKYIGQAVHLLSNGKKWGASGRWKNHIIKALNYKENVYKSSCRALDNAIRKYGVDNFTVDILKVCEEKDLNYWEEFYIKEYNTLYPNGYNLTTGGASHRKSDNTKKLMSEIMKIKGGHSQTEETKQKISNSLKNNKEWRKKHLENNKKKIGIPQKKQPRKNPIDNNLPKYISSKQRNNIVVGYVVHLPKTKTKSFTHSKFTMEEKLNQAIEYINSFNKHE